MEIKKFNYKEKEYEFVKPSFEFRIWSNKFITKYFDIANPKLKPLRNNLQSLLLKNEKLLNSVRNKEIENIYVSDIDNEMLTIQLEIIETESRLKEIFAIENREVILKECLNDFDITLLDSDDAGINFLIEVFDYFFTRIRKVGSY